MIHALGAGGGDVTDAEPWDLCIVGAGAAGLALAAEFLASPLRVIVLESGMHEPEPFDADLNELTSIGVRHDGWRAGRLRSLGGTTRAWGGQLVPMRSSELVERSWVPDSGWPLELRELEPYYRRVEQMLGTPGPPYDERNLNRLTIPRFPLDPERFQLRFSQWTALGRRNFAVLWRRALEKSRNISVLLDATAVAVRCSDSGDRCTAINVRSRRGAEASVRARAYVLACGGLETARVLLASPLCAGRTVANSSGLVGRYFQDHVSYVAGRVLPLRRAAIQRIFDPRYLGGTMFSLKVEPTERSMESNGWLNAMAHIAFQIPEALGWMEVRRIMRSVQAGRLELPSMQETIALIRGSGELARLILTRALARRRRSPSSAAILLLVDCEQAPHRDSRVFLDTATDTFGMPRLRLDWRLTDRELRTMQEFAREVAREFARLELGEVQLADEPDFERRDVLGAARDIYHHMGTTRMSTSPRSGVTTPALRCHDVHNLFIAGPSVFPTSGIANPTFTVLALSLRLADELKNVLGRAEWASLSTHAA